MNAHTRFSGRSYAPAPYTRETLAAIRAMVPSNSVSDIAVALNRDVGWVMRRAHDHGINLYGARTAADTLQAMIESPSLSPSDADKIKPHRKSQSQQIEEFAITLHPSIAKLFRFLASRIDGDYATSEEIANTVPSHRDAQSIPRSGRLLAAKLIDAKMPWRFESKMGRGGGLRLVRITNGAAQ